MAEKARYGLLAASAGRNSRRFAFADMEYVGMRMEAERLRMEYARLTGAS